MGVRCTDGTRFQPVHGFAGESQVRPPALWGRLSTCPTTRRAFTLIEMLTVIVIIGILASLITAAAIHARNSVKITMIRKDVSDLQQALEAYKLKYGEYPPEFNTFGFAAVINPNSPQGVIRRTAVLRHLNAAFPEYYQRITVLARAQKKDPFDIFAADIATYAVHLGGRWRPLDVTTFDSASSLLFWLGGLPEGKLVGGKLTGYIDLDAGEKWVPAGFHADPANPFRPGQPRREPLFNFAADRIVPLEPTPDDSTQFRPLRYYPPGIDRTPYVYFRARREAATGRFEYGAVVNNSFVCFSYIHGSNNLCVPYMDGPITADRPWCEQQKYQIITAGMDNVFGSIDATCYLRNLTTGDGISDADFDNITSVADGKLEDAMKQ